MYINDLFYKFLISKNKLKDTIENKEHLENANKSKLYFYDYLINKKIFTENEMYSLMGIYFNLPFNQISSMSVTEALSKKAPMYFLKDLGLFPFKNENQKIQTAISKPHNVYKINQLKAYFEDDIELILVSPSNLANLFEYVETRQKKNEALEDVASKKSKVEDVTEEEILVDSPAVQLADSILREAVASNASDIHIEPFEHYVRVRFRMDGYLIENTKVPKNTYSQLLARFKIIANLNIAERRIPQDGKITQTYNNQEYDFRISTLPTIHGEKIVIRVYNLDTSKLSINQLGFFTEQLVDVKKMIEKPFGIVLVTGPTGSGKTTTLYSFLKELNREDVNIITVEDPVENQILGINQVQINPKANLTFAAALRSILRQDPNIIMIGEIRDEETAQMAIRAAITGHLVFSTLHTNDAIGTLTRLTDMGVPRYLLADALSGSIAQRLCRRLCPHCRRKVKPTLAERERLDIDENTKIYKAKGCSECFHSGYRGRKAVFEVVNFNNDLKKLIENQEISTEEIRVKLEQLKIKFLRDSFKQLVLDGVTSIEEFDTIVGSN